MVVIIINVLNTLYKFKGMLLFYFSIWNICYDYFVSIWFRINVQ